MRLRGRPTLQTLGLVFAIFALQQAVGLLSVAEYFLFVMDRR